MNFQELKDINKQKIKMLENKDINNIDLKKQLEIQIKIQELLDKDEGLFFNIKFEEAIAILGEIIEQGKR